MSDQLKFPDSVSFQSCSRGMIQLMVSSVHEVSQSYPTRWQISGYAASPGWTALFVGKYFAIALLPNDYSLLLDRSIALAAAPELFKTLEASESRPWNRLGRIKFEDVDVDEVLEVFGEAHVQGMEIAAREGGGRPQMPRDDMWSSLALVASQLPRHGRRG